MLLKAHRSWPTILLYTGLIVCTWKKWHVINRVAVGRRGSCSAQVFFLVLLVTRGRPPLGQVLIGTLNHATCTVHFHFVANKSDCTIIWFVLMKWCGVYSNPWIIKNYCGMCTAFHLGIYGNLYSFERSMYFFLWVKQKSPIADLPNLHSCFRNSIEMRNMLFFIFIC